ncbi:hypothetical protein GGR54DRAFT_625065 [Hypoxylon sp. NC1633]|nr:hypothetical protein GGR54DRAFT_625065 [Hypoxylon sp. NC1633]
MEPAKELESGPPSTPPSSPPTTPLTPPRIALATLERIEEWMKNKATELADAAKPKPAGDGPSSSDRNLSDRKLLLRYPYHPQQFITSPQVSTPIKAFNPADHEIDVIYSPSLPKGFVFPGSDSPTPKSHRTTNSLSSNSSGNGDDSDKENEGYNLPQDRNFNGFITQFEDPFVDSTASEDDDSIYSDSTVTPALFAARQTAKARGLIPAPVAFNSPFELPSRSSSPETIIIYESDSENERLNESPAYDHKGIFPTSSSELDSPTSRDFNSDSSCQTVFSVSSFGTSEEMAPDHAAKNGIMESHAGPPLGTVKVGRQYFSEAHIRRIFIEKSLDPAREANYRLQGVQLIQSMREALSFPLKTYNAACTYYHHFRLEHGNQDYSYSDAALASLFVACKAEDSLKKSREIFCAHHNLKNPDHQATQDDKMFDQPSKIIIGLERQIMEAICFDFRVRYPQKAIIKIYKEVLGGSKDAPASIAVAMNISLDMYKTFAPIKHTSFTCAFVVVQLTALITGHWVDKFEALDPLDWHTDKQSVAEVMLDLLDLYTQHGKATKVGPMFDLQMFIDIQIIVNQQVENAGLSRYAPECKSCESSIVPATPATNSPVSLSTPSAVGTGIAKRGPKETDTSTARFLFAADEAAREWEIYDDYVKDEYEEVVEEHEERLPDRSDDRPQEPRGPRGPRGHHGHGHGHGRGRGHGPGHGHGPDRGSGHGRGHGRGGFDPGWTPRNRHDRRRRGGSFY